MSDRLSFADYAQALGDFIRYCSSPAGLACDLEETEGEFNRLALSLFRLQAVRNPAYAHFCQARGTKPERLDRWQEIPVMPVVGFKELDLTCLPPQERLTIFHSSGTTRQQPSRHVHNRASLALYEASLLPWFNAHVLPDLAPDWCGCLLCLSPSPAQAPHSSLVHMFDTVRRHFPAADFMFTGRAEGAARWSVELDRTCEVLRRAEVHALPVVLLGTAFSFVHLLEHLAKDQATVTLPQGSRLMETGGYKGQSRAVPKDQLHQQLGQRLGLAPNQIISEYGMSELSSQAYDHVYKPTSDPVITPAAPPARRTFRFPPWARARIVSPEHSREVAEGETGLIQVFDLANAYSGTGGGIRRSRRAPRRPV